MNAAVWPPGSHTMQRPAATARVRRDARAKAKLSCAARFALEEHPRPRALHSQHDEPARKAQQRDISLSTAQQLCHRC
jgi:hypothetical protein